MGQRCLTGRRIDRLGLVERVANDDATHRDLQLPHDARIQLDNLASGFPEASGGRAASMGESRAELQAESHVK